MGAVLAAVASLFMAATATAASPARDPVASGKEDPAPGEPVHSHSKGDTPRREHAASEPRDSAVAVPEGHEGKPRGTGPNVKPAKRQGASPTDQDPGEKPKTAAPKPAVAPAFEPGQLLVLWNDHRAADDGLALMARRYHQRPHLVSRLDALGVVIAQFQLPDTGAALALRARLRAEQPGWVSDLNARCTLQAGAPSGLAAPRLYALHRLQLGAPSVAASPGRRSTGVKLGVIDAELKPTLALNVGKLTVSSVLRPPDQPARIDHGDIVAQLIAGPPLGNGYSGAAGGVMLYWASAMRTVGGKPSSHTLYTAAALDWLLGQGVNLINLSLGGAGDAVLAAVVARLRDQPVLLVAAAGNDGPDAPPVYPAAYPGVLAVTAIDADDHVYAQANHGDYIGLAAPGVDLWVPVPSTDAGGNPAGQYVSGTSFATALASGVLANAGEPLWRVPRQPQLDRLCRAAEDLGPPGRDRVFGCGLVPVRVPALADSSSAAR